jgi:hypothetical protein
MQLFLFIPKKLFIIFVISGFCHEAEEICALLGHYAANTGNSLPMFCDKLSVPTGCTKSVGKKL